MRRRVYIASVRFSGKVAIFLMWIKQSWAKCL